MKTRLNAACVGALAAQALQERGRNPIGTVTNTFPNSFYARTFNDELLFVTNRSLKSPVTINIDSTSNIQKLVKPYERITIKESEILVGDDVSIHVENAAEYSAKIASGVNSSEFSNVQEALLTIAAILRIIDTKGSVLDQDGLTHSGAAEFVWRGVIPLRSSNEAQFRKAAESLVGLGPGFTPSGDDMLGGFLAVHNSLAEGIGHQPILLDFDVLKNKTNWISAKLLDYMQRLVLDQQMIRIIDSATSGKRDELVLALESLLPRGHTSGIDIVIGAVLGLGVMRDIALRTKEIETLARKLDLLS